MKQQIENLLLENNTQAAKKIIFDELNNISSKIEKHWLYLLLGTCYAMENNNDLAIQYYNYAYELAENDWEVVQVICNFLNNNGAKNAAKELLEKFYINQSINENEDLKLVNDEFDYSELIMNDVNDVIEKYHLDNRNMQKESKPRLLFTMFGWNESGGGTTFPKSICIELAKRGYDISVFYAALEHKTISEQYYMERWTDTGVRLFGVFNRPTMLYDLDNPMREVCDENIVKLFNKVLNEIQPDIVNFHNFVGLSFELASIVKQKNIVSTFTTHNYHLIDPKLYLYNNSKSWDNTDFFTNSDLVSRYPTLKEEYQQRINKAKNILLNDIDYILAISNRVRELLTEFIGNEKISDKKIAVINQVPEWVPSLLSPHNKNEQEKKQQNFKFPLKCTFIGHCLPHKGVHLIAQALQFIPNAKQLISVNIWGDISPDYEKTIKAIDKENIINFKGEYDSNYFYKIAEHSDVMLLLSLWEEAQGLVIIEGLALNLPVIAAKIGGVEDMIVDGYNGQLFTAGNPKSLASVLQMLIENSFKIAQMKQNCHLSYTFSDYISHLEGIYKRLFSGERPTAKEFNLLFRENLFI